MLSTRHYKYNNLFVYRLQVSVPASCEVDVCVNFGQSLGNAMWTSKSILVGDGVPGSSYPFVTLDVMCHEYGHCLTAAWSGLLIKGQSGGMNDAFSDALSQVSEFLLTCTLVLGLLCLYSRDQLSQYS